jgi:hypothetical protein
MRHVWSGNPHLEVSIVMGVMGVPPVLIPFIDGFSIKSTIQLWGTPMAMETMEQRLREESGAYVWREAQTYKCLACWAGFA